MSASHPFSGDPVFDLHVGGKMEIRSTVSLDGRDELSLAFLSTTEPPYEGVPAEVFQRGLYTTSAFTKDAQ